jgi:recombination protein RecA
LHGNEASGKSLLAYKIIANAQKMGGIACYLDIERALSQPFVERMGVNWDKLLRPKNIPITVEGCFAVVEKIMTLARTYVKDKNKPVVVVIDSIAALIGEEEVEKGQDESIALGLEAKAMSRALRKAVSSLDAANITLVCINQLRQKINIGFSGFGADTDITPHGKALAFYCGVRIKLKSIGQIKNSKTGQILGMKTEAKVYKNKVAPNHRSAKFPLYYDWGVNDEVSIYDYLLELEEIKGTTWKTWDACGEHFRWQGTEEWVKMMSRPDLRKAALDIVEQNMVLTFDKRCDAIEIDTDSTLEMEQLKADIQERNK